MTNYVLALLFLGLSLAAVVVRKTYYSLPLRELKRQAEKHDHLSAELYMAVAYGSSLRALLWIIVVVTSASGIVLLARTPAPFWLCLLTVVALLWAAYSWLPASRVTAVGARLTLLVNPVIIWLLEHLHPLLSRGAGQVEKRYSAPFHTGLFERADIVELIKQQAEQQDSRLTIEELAIAQRAMVFGDYLVRDILTPRKKVPTVLESDTIGPILIDELHKADAPFILVLDKPKGDIVGTLVIQKLGLHSSGLVRDHMSGPVYYLHENDTLHEATHAFFVTNSALFIVVNSFEEYVGIVTIESVMKQLLGHLPGDDFEQYANLSSVAARHPKPEQSGKSSKVIKKADSDTSEVVE